MKQAKVKSKPCTREITITLTVHDAVVLRAHLRRKNSAEAELLSAIVHEWATHPSRFPGNVSLPSENNVLFKDESLRSYLSRIALATIKAVLRQEGNIKKTALRLCYDRTALHKLISRLTVKMRVLLETRAAVKNLGNELSGLVKQLLDAATSSHGDLLSLNSHSQQSTDHEKWVMYQRNGIVLCPTKTPSKTTRNDDLHSRSADSPTSPELPTCGLQMSVSFTR